MPKVTLTASDRFYIENNSSKSEDELSKDINKPLPLIQEHLHRVRAESRISKLMIREKGAVAMTEGASMAADESRTGRSVQIAIDNAISRRDYDEAARLQREVFEKKSDETSQARERNKKYIHYIHQND